ncbi:MAG: hypothetical protein EOO01_38985 [Chitinophagaceae bacterium]|nr:MAG: hypothetical protein EOO01_38985 [Chitinophagaceae bacterium]
MNSEQTDICGPAVTVSCGTKFHSDHVAYQLDKRGLLDKVLTSHPAKYYLNRVSLAKKKVQFLPPVFLLVYGLRKVLGSSHRITNWFNYRLPVVYDYLASRSVKRSTEAPRAAAMTRYPTRIFSTRPPWQ